jgi:hypothetical protein
MGTDYTTRLIYEDLTVDQFLEHCATEFRKSINVTPNVGVKPVDTVPSKNVNDLSIYTTNLYDLRDELEELCAMTQEQKIEYGTKYRVREIDTYEFWIKGELTLRARLIDMENQVQRWVAPTPEFEVLKVFAAGQIRNTIIAHNEDVVHYEAELKICQERSPLDYHKLVVFRIKNNIDFCDKAIQERTEPSYN